jgi:hypothetical protein
LLVKGLKINDKGDFLGFNSILFIKVEGEDPLEGAGPSGCWRAVLETNKPVPARKLIRAGQGAYLQNGTHAL